MNLPGQDNSHCLHVLTLITALNKLFFNEDLTIWEIWELNSISINKEIFEKIIEEKQIFITDNYRNFKEILFIHPRNKINSKSLPVHSIVFSDFYEKVKFVLNFSLSLKCPSVVFTGKKNYLFWEDILKILDIPYTSDFDSKFMIILQRFSEYSRKKLNLIRSKFGNIPVFFDERKEVSLYDMIFTLTTEVSRKRLLNKCLFYYVFRTMNEKIKYTEYYSKEHKKLIRKLLKKEKKIIRLKRINKKSRHKFFEIYYISASGKDSTMKMKKGKVSLRRISKCSKIVLAEGIDWNINEIPSSLKKILSVAKNPVEIFYPVCENFYEDLNEDFCDNLNESFFADTLDNKFDFSKNEDTCHW
ncbi:MAG: hypothetical protein QW350_04625 [Candidatus Aenigmatarchaeota archaeon]